MQISIATVKLLLLLCNNMAMHARMSEKLIIRVTHNNIAYIVSVINSLKPTVLILLLLNGTIDWNYERG